MNMQTIAEPLPVRPRLDAKPWGGRRLATYGIDLVGQADIGEAVLTSNDVIVADGSYAGESIQRLVSANPAGLLGPRGLALAGPHVDFPLLVKLIDAHEHLSIQVHPSDALAPAGMRGKTEAWYILEAEPESIVYAGLNTGVSSADVRARLESGDSIVPLIRTIPVRAGQVLFLPAGTIHALGAGIVLYEIQQQSAITYRLEDWGRAREMHIAQGLAALDANSRPEPHSPGLRSARSRPRPAVECPYFSLEIIQLAPGDHVVIGPESGPQVFTCVSGHAELGASRFDVPLPAGQTAILFANAGPARLASLHGGRVLRGWIGG
jgi:mannose-6-phosphate isomerase